ncbi:hypothetical protein C8F01DRAFT_1373330 [Mycena amicta]|nr:hypothetical protein C8F01DRAFT_1373330 [Mycena amicta]
MNLSTCSGWILGLNSLAGAWRESDHHTMDNNWTRCNTRNEFPFNPPMISWRSGIMVMDNMHPWLSQSNHIMKHLNNPSKDYAVVHEIIFQLMIPETSQPLPKGNVPLARLPCVLSLDPTGVERLGTEEAEGLGFPAFELATSVEVVSWDDSVYAGIRRFQRAKGFDPYTQDAARELGHPLYELPVGADWEDMHGSSGHLEELDRPVPVVDEELEEKLDSWTLLD